MNIDSIRTVSLRTAKTYVIECLKANLVPNLIGSPGIGKSAIVKDIANEFNLELIDYRASTGVPEDQQGLPFRDGNKATFLPFSNIFPIANSKVPEGKNGWLLFLDEMNAASKPMQAALYKLILDRYVGQYPLHESVYIITAGNRQSDKAITNSLSTAMISRLVHIDIEPSTKEWMEDIALKQNYDMRIVAYLSQYPQKLSTFDPDNSEYSYCCPRSWEFMNKLIQVSDRKTGLDPNMLPLYAGTIDPGIAADFVQFTNVFDDLVKLQDILKDPKNTAVPSDLSIKWATISMMLMHIEDSTIEPICEYGSRFDASFRVLLFRGIIQKYPKYLTHKAIANSLVELQKYLYD